MVTRFRRRSDGFAAVGTTVIVFAGWAYLERDDVE
jgi:hypothetical protein